MNQDSREKKPGKRGIFGFIRSVFASPQRTFTVMVVPHSHKKSFHIKINIYAVLLVMVVAALVVVSFIVLAAEYTASDTLQVQQRQADQQAEAELERVIGEIGRLQQQTREFDAAMSQALTRFGLESADTGSGRPADGDLGDLFGLQEVQDGDFRELYNLQQMRSSLESSLEPMQRIYAAVQDQQDLLEDIPHLWPIQHGKGTVVSGFGPGFHPVFDVWHINRGVKIAVPGFGNPVISAANGTVAAVRFDPAERGWYVRIEHRYGISTQYAHLNGVFVSEGERVSQGQAIGEVGDTGYVTAPQLGFEIMLGSDMLDPADFILSADSAGRWTGPRRSGT
ncbi:metalloendopeptidase-like membrane protein [Spirochaeta africana DSM 8902]|uniref:Metalloendopeptidase-like membrane protein n=1 Tax=Spirochaeta africana (strain ATCC 700263 / DSM 8902 / Z-7692) TaxID=889378 RepID=H9UKF9_SPIAZ|nr:metalloendopeptidase-like membrane protein [Spirochaeta africana DSM 8902]